jgi:outer membrane cobalamin receptor
MQLLASLSPVVALGIAIVACGPSTHRSRLGVETRPGEITIDQVAIENSGANTAWEVIKRAAPQFNYTETKYGHPASLRRRGQSSIMLVDAPLLFIDGVKSPDFRTLENIPASSIFQIHILNGIEGTTRYGTNAVGGVILIQTKNGSEP